MSDDLTDQEVAPYYKIMNFYPWQDNVWEKLFSRHIHNDHFPHALLINGVAGIGKRDFAFYLSKGLLCQSPKKPLHSQLFEPCGQCRACQLFCLGNHPDLYHLTTPEDKKVIPVESVRELIQWSVLNSQLDGKKVIIIEPAEAMNQNAANSLLKTLEEPVSDTIIIMLADNKQALLATIRSRCQAVDMVVPNRSISLHWLQQQIEFQNIESAQIELMISLSNNAPLLALNAFKSGHAEVRQLIMDKIISIVKDDIDPVQIADELTKMTAKKKSKTIMITPYDVIYWLDAIIIDIVRLSQQKSPQAPKSIINNIDCFIILQELSNRLSLKKMLQLSTIIQKSYYDIKGSININLLFEQLFIDWKNCKR